MATGHEPVEAGGDSLRPPGVQGYRDTSAKLLGSKVRKVVVT